MLLLCAPQNILSCLDPRSFARIVLFRLSSAITAHADAPLSDNEQWLCATRVAQCSNNAALQQFFRRMLALRRIANANTTVPEALTKMALTCEACGTPLNKHVALRIWANRASAGVCCCLCFAEQRPFLWDCVTKTCLRYNEDNQGRESFQHLLPKERPTDAFVFVFSRLEIIRASRRRTCRRALKNKLQNALQLFARLKSSEPVDPGIIDVLAWFEMVKLRARLRRCALTPGFIAHSYRKATGLTTREAMHGRASSYVRM